MPFKTTTVLLLLLLNGCATTINDFQACALVPSVVNGQLIPWGNGAVCDNFLTSQPVTLSQASWEAQLLAEENQGVVPEVITSTALGNLKKEVEALCSDANGGCTYAMSQAVKNVSSNIERLQGLGDKAKKLIK